MSTFVIVPGACDTPSKMEPVIDPFEAGEGAGVGAFDGLILSAGPGVCTVNIDRYVAAADPVERDSVRTYLERTQWPQGIRVLREKWIGDLPASRRRTYALTTADTLVPPQAQREMAASVGTDVVEVHAHHGIFREQPCVSPKCSSPPPTDRLTSPWGGP